MPKRISQMLQETSFDSALLTKLDLAIMSVYRTIETMIGVYCAKASWGLRQRRIQ